MNNTNPEQNNTHDKQDILEALKNKKIKPHSKLFFRTRKYALITTILGTIIAIGAILSTVIFLILDRDSEIFIYLNRNYYQHLFYGIPFFWIFILIILIYGTIIIQKKIGRGYRNGKERVFPVLLIIISLITWGFFFGGLKDTIHTFLYRNVPLYRPLTDSKEELWDNPNNGMIFGTINTITADGFTLDTDDEGSWVIYMTPDTIFDSNLNPLHKGQVVKITGNSNSNNDFEATIVQKWSTVEQN